MATYGYESSGVTDGNGSARAARRKAQQLGVRS